jgi:serine protease Do
MHSRVRRTSSRVFNYRLQVRQMRIADNNDTRTRYAGSKRCRYLAVAGMIGFLGLFAGVGPVRAAGARPSGEHSWKGSQGYLGVSFRDVAEDQVTALRLKDPRGAEIFLMDHDGPACKSGLREHDVILQMNGQVIEGEEELRRLLHETPAGRTVTFVISRDGQTQTISTQLADRDKIGQEAWERHMTVSDPSQSPEPGWRGSGFLRGGGSSNVDAPRHGFLGTTILSSSYTGALLELMGPQLQDFFGAQGGLLVRAVDPNSPAAVAGMRAGDVVVKINSIPIVSSADWLKTVHENRGRPLSVVVLRDRKEQILTLTPDSKKRSSVMPKLWPGAKARTEQTDSEQVGMLRSPAAME